MKVIDIIKNSPITGVQYGLVEVQENVKTISHHQMNHNICHPQKIHSMPIRHKYTRQKLGNANPVSLNQDQINQLICNKRIRQK